MMIVHIITTAAGTAAFATVRHQKGVSERVLVERIVNTL
jgi:hypothetical protein